MAGGKLWQCFCILGCMLIFLQAEAVDGGIVNITYLNGARDVGAVCLDGSAPAYYFEPGSGDGANNWIVHLEGGGWCWCELSCLWRSQGYLGSSTKYEAQVNLGGILGNNQNINPAFYNWNKMLIKYCDGASFTGDAEIRDPTNSTNILFSRGQKIYEAMMQEALTKGMANAKNALLMGASAGGLAAALHCDQFRNMLPSTNTKCLMDAGFFIHMKEPDVTPIPSGEIQVPGSREEYFDRLVGAHKIPAKNLPQSCASKMKLSLCFFPQYVAPHIQTPLFVLNSLFDSYQVNWTLHLFEMAEKCKAGVGCSLLTPDELKRMQDFRDIMINMVTRLGNSPSNGWYLESCYRHGEYNWKRGADMLNGRTIAIAVRDWYYDKEVVRDIDLEHTSPRMCT